MKIAIIGSGISGLVCAHLLHNDYDLSIFEANDYIGGHTHTIDVSRQEGSYAIDTGFIVFNKVTYPNFCKLMDQLGVASQPTRMNFSVRCEKTGLEYGVWFGFSRYAVCAAPEYPVPVILAHGA
jgi:predicted NAD/FAD-binding protein